MTFGNKYKPVKNLNPGPGDYDHSTQHTNKDRAPSAKIGMSERRHSPFDNKAKAETPAPGMYNDLDGHKVTKKKANAFTMPGKIKERPSNTPGPGSYMDTSRTINQLKSQNLNSTKGNISRDGRKTEQSFMMQGSGVNAKFGDPSALTS